MKKLLFYFLCVSFLLYGCSKKKEDTSQQPETPKTSESTNSSTNDGKDLIGQDIHLIVTESVTLRSKPDVNSSRVTCVENAYIEDVNLDVKNDWSCASGQCFREVTAFQRETHLNSDMRTKNAVQVDKWNAVWHRVNFNYSNGVGIFGEDGASFKNYYSCGEKEVWIYGQFVK